jgi:hypothetical protein
MKSFLCRLFYFLIPFYLVIISYFYFDPFKVLYNYGDFYKHVFYSLNRENVSFHIYNKEKISRGYNSFIFGSSRTIAFKTYEWAKFIHGHNFVPFVFDASGESLKGITSKIEYLDKTGAPIKNVLLVICSDITFKRDSKLDKSHLYINHPALSTNSNLGYYLTFFKAYFQKGFFIKYFDYLVFHKERRYMSDCLDFRNVRNDLVSNDLFLDDQEFDIQRDSLSYFDKHRMTFFSRQNNEVFYNEQIDTYNIKELEKIRDIFKQHSTNFKIIISPLYDQKRLNPSDLKNLVDIFSKENVFDYSGKNIITNNKYNYFENSHYRYRVGKKIMQEIYKR